MKKSLTLAIAILGSAAAMQARLHHFFYDDMFEEMDHMHERMLNMNRELWSSLNTPLSQEEAEAIKKARTNLAKIKPEITQNDSNIVITLPIANVDKKAITITVEDNVLNGTIPTADGKVEFAVINNYLEVARRIEIKKENKTDGKQALVHYGSLANKVYFLPQVVDINTVKAETKDTLLTLTFAKKKQAKVAIAHN